MKVVSLYHTLLVPYCENPSLFEKPAMKFYNAVYIFKCNLFLERFNIDESFNITSSISQENINKIRRINRLKKVKDLLSMHERKEKVDQRINKNIDSYPEKLKKSFILSYATYIKEIINENKNQISLDTLHDLIFKKLNESYINYFYEIKYILNNSSLSELSNSISLSYINKLNIISDLLIDEIKTSSTFFSEQIMNLTFLQFIYFGPLYANLVFEKVDFMELLKEDTKQYLYENLNIKTKPTKIKRMSLPEKRVLFVK